MSKRQIILILIVALAVRLGYHELVPWFEGSYHNGSDSGKYIGRALSIMEHGEMVRFVDGEARPDYDRMPLYPAFLAAAFQVFGAGNLASATMIQAVIGTLTVLAIGLIAGAMNPRWMMPAALLSCFWPALVVYTSWILTDSLFVDFFTWGLCACIWAFKNHRPIPLLLLAGLAFGLALLTRPILMFLPYFLVPVLAYAFVAARKISWPRAIGYALVPAAIMIALLTPRLVSTYLDYGAPVVTTQSGSHALNLIYPCTRDDRTCDRASYNLKVRLLIEEELSGLTEDEKNNPVIVDTIRRKIALPLILEIPFDILVLSVANSAVRSIVQTMLYEVGYQLNQDPQYFSASSGATIGEKMKNFVRVIFTDAFMFVWALAQISILLTLPFQFIGIYCGVKNKTLRPHVLFLIVTAGYFLIINVSFGSPKYGLPLNPAGIVLLVAGASIALEWLRQRRTTKGH